jgi:hypothetical protein
MKIMNAFPSKYLRAADLEDQDKLVTIKHIQIEEIAGNEHKPVLYFVEETKGMVLNKVNSKIIAKAYGEETDSWPGKKVVMYMAMVDLRGDMVEAIRLRTPRQMPASGLAGSPTKAPAHHNEANPPPFDDEVPF